MEEASKAGGNHLKTKCFRCERYIYIDGHNKNMRLVCYDCMYSKPNIITGYKIKENKGDNRE